MTAQDDDVAAAKADAPPPDDPRKPGSPADLHRRSWRYVLRTTVREVQRDQCTDIAASLTYYAVLAAAPALIALVSVLGLVADPERTVQRVLDVLGPIVPEDVLPQIEALVQGAASGQRAGLALVLGLAVALWSASGYVGAFGRAMNRVYETDEGRPIWKLRPLLLLVTLVVVVLAAVLVATLVLSGPLARSVGEAVGLSSAAVTVWQVVKWPVVLLLVVVVVAILYHWTPNVRQPRFRWLSVGAVVAIVVWVLASALFALYVGNFARYDATYGALAGVVVLLLWLWLTNLALLFGAELDAELERGRQLQAGIAAEETLQLPPRDTAASDKRARRLEEDVERGRALRESAGTQDDLAVSGGHEAAGGSAGEGAGDAAGEQGRGTEPPARERA